MSESQSSVAPTERISIHYRSRQQDEEQEIELPLSLLVLANLTGSADPQPLAQRQPVRIDKQNFNAVMQQAGLQLTLDVSNRLDGRSAERLHCALAFTSLADFTPDHLVEQIPELQRLLRLRQALAALKGPLRNQPAFRQQLFRLLSDPAQRQQLLLELTADHNPA